MSTCRPEAPRKEPTQERAKETIRILLEATDHVVRERGAANASIAAIRAGERNRLRVKDARRAAHVTVRVVMLLAPLAATATFSPEQRQAVISDVEALVMAFLFGTALPPES